MARICEICGRIDEAQEDQLEHDLHDVCETCTVDIRQNPFLEF